MAKQTRGYKPADLTKIKGRLKTSSPLDDSMRALLVKDPETDTSKKIKEKTKIPVRKVKNLSDIISNNIQASTDLRTITHYIKRAESIWTTLLLKPNGDQDQLFIYDTKNSPLKNGKLHDMLLQVVMNHFTTKYPFESVVPQIIKDVLFRTGSYCIVNFSHAVIDHIINGYEIDGNESAIKPTLEPVLRQNFVDNDWKKARNIGYIRKNKNANLSSLTGFESLYGGVSEREPEFNLVHEDLNWTFTDNPIVIKAGELFSEVRGHRLRSISGLENMESAVDNIFIDSKRNSRKINNNHVTVMNKKDLDEELKNLYPERRYEQRDTLSVKSGRYYTGNGKLDSLRKHWPSESVILVSQNGELGKPFGGIFLIDPETGEPLKTTTDTKYYQTDKGSNNESTSSGLKSGSLNDVIRHIKSISNGADCTEDMGWMAELTSATLEKEMMEAFFNGDLHKNVGISLSAENVNLYMSRALKQQGVRAVFIPIEYMTYIAVDYSQLGIGRSLVDEAKLHITRLAALETADILAQIENAISHTMLTIDLEEEDIDPRQLASQIRNEYFANNPTLHDIIGYNNLSIDSILDRYKEQSLTIKINANENPGIIAPQIETRQADRELLKPIDRDTRENLLNTIAGYFCLKRSWLEDTGEGNDFAIEALADQELLRNQTNDFSRIFSAGFTDVIQKHINVTPSLIAELVAVIQKNSKLYLKPDQASNAQEEFKKLTEEGKIKTILVDFVNSIYVTLPTPAIVESLNKVDDKIEAINKLVTSYIEMAGGYPALRNRIAILNANGADLDEETVVNHLKGALLNDAFRRFNIPRPFEDIGDNGAAGGMLNIINQMVDQDANMINFLSGWINGMTKNNSSLEKVIKKASEEDNPIQEGGELKDPSSEPENDPNGELDDGTEEEPKEEPDNDDDDNDDVGVE